MNKKPEIICFFSDSTCYGVVLLYFWRKGVEGLFFVVVFSSLFFKEQSEGVFVAIGRRYVVGYRAVSREKRKFYKTDGY